MLTPNQTQATAYAHARKTKSGKLYAVAYLTYRIRQAKGEPAVLPAWPEPYTVHEAEGKCIRDTIDAILAGAN